MATALTTVFAAIIDCVLDFFTSVVLDTNVVQWFVVGVGISLVLVCVKIVRSLVWGA